MKIKKNIAYVLSCKYSKCMNNLFNPEKDIKESKQNSRFAQKTVYVREDDQDWGSAGMNDVLIDSE